MTRLRRRIEDVVREALKAYNRERKSGYEGDPHYEELTKAFTAACNVAEDKVGDMVQELLDMQDKATRDWAHEEGNDE